MQSYGGRWDVRAIKPVDLTRGLAVLVCGVGVAGLTLDAWPRPPHGWINLHPLFGTLLLIAVIVQFQRREKDVRQLSRAVYLLLYLLFAVNQLVRQPPENVRDYLAYGFLALLSIHLLSALRDINARRRRAPQKNQAASSGAVEVAPPWPRAPVQNQR
jgi:cytochrome b561